MKVLVKVLILMVFSSSAFAQTTLILRPNAAAGKDVNITSGGPTINYGTNDQITALAWTNSSTPVTARTLIDFDLSSLPANALVTSAVLTLYFNPDAPSLYQNQGANAMWIQRVTSTWNENAVTWNTMPTVTTTNRVSVPASTSVTQNYTIGITQLIKDIRANPTTSYGLMMSLQTETSYKSVMMSSSDHINVALHPKLEITYIIPVGPTDCISLQPGASIGKDVNITSAAPTLNYGTNDQITALAWTNSSTAVSARTLIDFDLSSLPADAVVTSAELTLYFNPNAPSLYQNQGSNALWIQRVTSTWDEAKVTWNTMPTVTTTNRVSVPASTSATQNYTFSITQLIEDIRANPSSSFGLMMSLQTETAYKSVMMSSSDHSNAALHPKLDICYTRVITTGIIKSQKTISSNVYPNPFTHSTTIEFNEQMSLDNAVISIYDLTGTEVQSNVITLSGNNSFNLQRGNLKEGLYFYTVKSGSQVITTGKLNVMN